MSQVRDVHCWIFADIFKLIWPISDTDICTYLSSTYCREHQVSLVMELTYYYAILNFNTFVCRYRLHADIIVHPLYELITWRLLATTFRSNWEHPVLFLQGNRDERENVDISLAKQDAQVKSASLSFIFNVYLQLGGFYSVNYLTYWLQRYACIAVLLIVPVCCWRKQAGDRWVQV